jgi:hypothetical protein
MKLHIRTGNTILLLIFFCATGCKKSTQPDLPSNENPSHDSTLAVTNVPYPSTPLQECNAAPFYGDSVVYPQPGAADFYVYPQNNKGVAGTYLSWPDGLTIDPNTGAIDLTKSETGVRYSVAFIHSGSTDTCMSQLIIGGVSYIDSVYVLSQSYKTAVPYFNANPSVPSICDNNQGNACQFDYNNVAHNQGIEIDHKTGYIDLAKTIQNIPSNMTLPNGFTYYTTINYKLDDNSNNAPQQIILKLIYYKHKSDIPANVLATVSANQNNTLNNHILTEGPSPRPPVIIIVRAL